VRPWRLVQHSVSYTNSFPFALTDWSTNDALHQFNPSLGTLLSADIQVYSALTTTISVTNTGTNRLSAAFATTELAIDFGPNNLGNLNTNSTGFKNANSGSPFAVDYQSAEFFFNNLAAGASASASKAGNSGWIDSGLITDNPTLTLLTGNGYYYLPTCTTTFSDTYLQSGNVGAGQVTHADFESIITYVYAVPEPSTLALMATSLTALSLATRRCRPQQG
jgi:PEP-CTERM motif